MHSVICTVHFSLHTLYNVRVCINLLSVPLSISITSYGLWLLNSNHQTARENAILFFAYAFRFSVLLSLFDQKGGLRKLLNAVWC